MLILEVKWLRVSPCTSNIPNIGTVKPRSTDTRLIRTAGYYGQFCLCQFCLYQTTAPANLKGSSQCIFVNSSSRRSAISTHRARQNAS